MDNLKAILEGEYDNAADLMGIDTDGGDLLGRLAKLPKEKQGVAIRQIMRGSGNLSFGAESSRKELEKRIMQLPKDIRDGLVNKRLQLADARMYVVKEISLKNTIDIFQGTDQKSIGLGNIANQKLEKDNWLLLYGIRMLYAVSATKEAADFTHIPPVVRNGEFELEAGNKKLVGLIDNTVFDTRDRNDIPIGFYKLESSKMIEPQVEIKMPVKFAAAAADTTWLRVTFLGTSVIPY